MGIARIASYPLPAEDQIPAPRVPWKLEASRAALLIHDMQEYFVAVLEPDSPLVTQLTENIRRLASECRRLGIPVFYTAQNGDQLRCDRGLQADFWGPGMSSSAAHQAIIPALAPQPGDIQMVKHRYSAFQRSHFADQLRVRQRDQLIICGVYAQIGCLLTAADAFQRDIEPFLAADAVAAYSQEKHHEALAYVAHCCGVTLSTQAILNALTN